ncbi:hypothetical protein F1188_16390 [Roseospira marina]|uniref:DUF1515 domain-containing protein n=1 Tax=Roseospira marina TaxID=140057 RepID=A0A5M6I863_9PROT|nr:hypothetical protein [Roseospira marina]KAA5604436.1 hypothetical protein F1188_16390 [Roseospira marina]MBB4315492.1 methyl-accepting chemotaxis protein [Roseospira marina]MBB5089445.1 methyl-accepting chemotaxis protein [Roseospira marina]
MTTPEQGLTVFRTEINARIENIEKWLERVTVAVEKLTENRERIVVLELKLKAELTRQDREIELLHQEMTKIAEVLANIRKDNTRQAVSIAKLDVVKGGALAVIGVILGGVVTYFVNLWKS